MTSTHPQRFHRLDPVPRDTGLRPLVVRRLIRAMFSQRLVAGDRLVVGKLATQLGASSTPVREALLELNTLGLVELIPNRGAVCLEFGAEQLRDMYLVRRVLEVEATRRVAENASSGGEANKLLHVLRERLMTLAAGDDATSGWLDEAVGVDVALHQTIAEGCGSRRLCHEIERYRELMVCVREVVGNEHSGQRIATQEHIFLIDHMLAGRIKEAADGMGQHLEHTAELVADLLFCVRDGEQPGFGNAENSSEHGRAHMSELSGDFTRSGKAG